MAAALIPAIAALLEGLGIGAAGGLALAPLAPSEPLPMTNGADMAEERYRDAAGTEACSTCEPEPPPECRQAAAEVKEALYRNKRLVGSKGGFHGYLNRMVEQMCGAYGPGTAAFKSHLKELEGAYRRLQNGAKKLRELKCSDTKLFSRKERLVIQNITQGSTGWTPATIEFKGRSHEHCWNFSMLRDTGNLGDLLSIIRPGI